MAKNSEKIWKNGAKKYCVQSGDNIYPEDGRFSIADSNVTYEEKNKELRKEKNANFQTMIPRDLFEEINAFLTEKGMTKVDFIKKAYEIMKKED